MCSSSYRGLGRSQGGKPVLQEVTIKREGVGDREPLHHNKADGIGQGKALVVVLRQESSCRSLICSTGSHNGRVAPVDFHKHAQGNVVAQADKQESMGLGQDEVRGEEAIAMSNQELLKFA